MPRVLVQAGSLVDGLGDAGAGDPSQPGEMAQSFGADFQVVALQLFRVRLPRTAVDLAAYELMVRSFLAEVDRDLEAVQTLIGAAA